MQEKKLQQTWKTRPVPWQAELLGGGTLEVVYPGEENLHAGPDFLSAIIKINRTVHVADVEIHLRASDWFRHGHAADRSYRRVVLHVVAVADVMQPRGVFYPPFTLELVPVDRTDVSLSSIRPEVLKNLARERFQQRLCLMKQEVIGFDEFSFKTLWQACGFPHNQMPYRQMANWLWTVGVENTLPYGWHELADKLNGYFFGQREKCSFQSVTPALPRLLWNLGGVRPVAHPHRKIIQFAQLLESKAWPAISEELREGLYGRLPVPKLLRHLRRIFIPPGEKYGWMSRARIIEWLVSFALPWLYLRATTGGSAGFAAYLEHLYFELPVGFVFHRSPVTSGFTHAWQFQALHQAAVRPA